MVVDNEYIDSPPPQDFFFAAADLLSHSSSGSDKYERAWLKVKEIHSSVLSDG